MTGFDGNRYRKEVLKPLLDSGTTDLDDKFALAGLDPATDDDEVIEARLAEVVAFWRREQSQPRYKGLAAALLAQREQMAEVLLDPVRRAELRSRRQAAGAAADAARFGRLDDTLAKLAARHGGAIPQDRIDRLRAAAARDGIGDDEFAARLAAYPLLDATASAAPVEPLAEAVRRQIATLLDEYRRLGADEDPAAAEVRSLYALLEVPPEAPAEELRQQHEALVARNRQRRHDRLKTVVDELAAHVRTHLLEGDRARYTASVSLDAAGLLRPEVETAIVLDDRVNAATFDRLVRRAMGLGLDPHAARGVVAGVAAELGGSVEMAEAGTYVACVACGAAEPADPTIRRCSHCGAELYVPCPGCGREIESSIDRCPHCRLDLRSRHQAERALRRARDRLVAGRPEDAALLVGQAERLVDDLEDLADLRREVARARDTALGAWRMLDEALRDARYGDADRLLSSLEERAADVVAPDGRRVEVVRAELDGHLSGRRRALEAASTLVGVEREQALADLVEAGPDHREALDALRALPPGPPGDVQAQVVGGGVEVTWELSSSPGPIVYRVARVTEEDGGSGGRAQVGSVGQPPLVDAGAPELGRVTYAVEAVRLGAVSGEVRSAVLTLAGGVRDVVARAGDGRVVLTWRQPTVGEVVVTRSRPDGGEPDRRMRTEEGSLIDTEVVNGVAYRYEIVLRRDGPGGEMKAEPQVVEAQPQGPPPPLRGLVTAASTGHIRISFPPPPQGEVRILRVDELGGWRAGEVRDVGELVPAGATVISLPVEGGVAVDRGGGGPRWYVPVTVAGEVATVGQPVRHPGIDDATDLRVDDEGADLVARWTWPPRCTEVQVIWERVGTHAEYEAKVTNARYDVDGGWRLADAPPGEYLVGVVPGARVGSELVWSPNPGPSARVRHRRA